VAALEIFEDFNVVILPLEAAGYSFVVDLVLSLARLVVTISRMFLLALDISCT